MGRQEVFRKGVEDTRMNGHPRFYELVEKIKDTHNRKNSDYAKQNDPLSNLKSSENYFNIPGYLGTAIRMADKWERFTNLLRKGEASVTEESIKDTLEDLAVYSLLEIILIEDYESRNTGEDRGHTKVI